MAKQQTAKRAGFKQVFAVSNFFKFQKEGDEFHGVFLEASERESKKFSNTAWVWTCADMDGVITLISEKTVMSTYRHQLKKGDEFILVYAGEKASGGGKRPYKDFEFYVKDYSKE